MTAYNTLEDLMSSIHTFSKEELERLEKELRAILEKEQATGEEEYVETPLEDFDFADDADDADDLSTFAALADKLDRQGLFETANEVDGLIVKLAMKKFKRGHTLAQWVRQLKKLKASQRIIEKFRRTYKEGLAFAKTKDKLKGKEEEYALREAVKKLPKKYLKDEPIKKEALSGKERGYYKDYWQGQSERSDGFGGTGIRNPGTSAKAPHFDFGSSGDADFNRKQKNMRILRDYVKKSSEILMTTLQAARSLKLMVLDFVGLAKHYKVEPEKVFEEDWTQAAWRIEDVAKLSDFIEDKEASQEFSLSKRAQNNN